jgi:hypothetical protein
LRNKQIQLKTIAGTGFAYEYGNRLPQTGEGSKGRTVRRTMLLSDSLTVRGDAVAYAIELAKRTNTDLVLLVLLSVDDHGLSYNGHQFAEQLTRLEKALLEHVAQARAAGVSGEAIVKTGDRSSELVKFLAVSGSFQTIVWGGHRELADTSARGKRSHWLMKMKDTVECPVVVPSTKS